MPLRTNGPELRRRRELLGLTIGQLAKRMGYSKHHVNEVELGRSNGGPAFHRKAAKVLGCRIADITCGSIPYGSTAAVPADIPRPRRAQAH